MRRLVLDAGVVASWFDRDGAGRRLRAEYEAGRLVVIGPSHLPQDVLGAMAASNRADGELLGRIGLEVGRLGFNLRDASPGHLARWITGGLPPHRAAYVALADELDLPLVTSDDDALGAAGSRARRPEDA